MHKVIISERVTGYTRDERGVITGAVVVRTWSDGTTTTSTEPASEGRGDMRIPEQKP